MTALDKRWVGTTSGYTTATNWAPISLRNSGYSWTLSGSGTGNYYLRTSGNANPGISTPGAVYANGATMTSGTAGSLTAGQYGYGDADTLGYSTIYVRLSDSTDPDTKSQDYVQLYQVPVATDNVRIPAGSGAITGVDQSSVAIGDFIVEEGYTGTIGSATAPLRIDPDKFEFAGTGISYIDIGTAAIDVEVKNAGTGQSGTAGLYLIGSAMDEVSIAKGAVGIAMLHGNAASAATVRLNGQAATVYLGKGCTLATLYVVQGTAYQRCESTTTTIYGGKLFTEEAGAIATLNVNGNAYATLNSTGMVGTLNQTGSSSTVDLLQSAETRTITNYNWSDGTLLIDENYVTITNRPAWQDGPKRLSMASA